MFFHAKPLIDILENLSFSDIRLEIVGKANLNEWGGKITPQIFVEDYNIFDSSLMFWLLILTIILSMLGGMNLNITKRNGELIEFDRENIINAVAKAFIEVDGYVSSDSKILIEQIADEVEKNCYEGINVELI